MYRIIQKANYDLPDVADFVKKIPNDFFAGTGEIIVTRSPGRLDVMGGIADYSGSLVLEMPISEAVFAALQKRDDLLIKIFSTDQKENLKFEMSLQDFFQNNGLVEYSSACQFFKKNSQNQWAAYIAGVFLVLMREKQIEFEHGANIFIDSTIPQGKGVSSSAALEAAVMSAVIASFDISLEPREMAILCQKVENLVVGAPCGIMDQMSVICGKKDELISMICQPAELNPPVKIPSEITFWGIDSGIRHSVGGGDYGSVRTGAFMGYRIIAHLAGLSYSNDERIEINDKKWRGFLSNITPQEFENNYLEKLPKEISGADFLEKYGGTTDLVTNVLPEKTYAIYYPTLHPIYENARVNQFSKSLKRGMTEENLIELGELMFAAHESYSTCGLGSEGTDLLVELVKKIGIGKGLFGAKITGGGSGGTVAVIGLKDSEAAIEKIVDEYQKQTGYRPYVFKGSSPGVTQFGFLKLVKN